jgi:hypothetical protein
MASSLDARVAADVATPVVVDPVVAELALVTLDDTVPVGVGEAVAAKVPLPGLEPPLPGAPLGIPIPDPGPPAPPPPELEFATPPLA